MTSVMVQTHRSSARRIAQAAIPKPRAISPKPGKRPRTIPGGASIPGLDVPPSGPRAGRTSSASMPRPKSISPGSGRLPPLLPERDHDLMPGTRKSPGAEGVTNSRAGGRMPVVD